MRDALLWLLWGGASVVIIGYCGLTWLFIAFAGRNALTMWRNL